VVGNVPVELFDLGYGDSRIDVADNYQDGVAGGVPLLVKGLEHGAGGGIERGPGAEGIVRVGCSGEHIAVQTVNELVGGIGEVAGYFLLDGAPFVGPLFFGVIDATQAGCLGLQCYVEVGGGHGGEVLGDILLGVGIVAATQLGVDGGCLIGGHAGAAAEGHVFLSVSRAGEAGRGFVSTNFEVQLHRDDGRQGAVHNDYLQTVGKSGAGDVAGIRSMQREHGEQE
jgi:hypothetical protein